jgi:hypothetical protein
MGQFEQRAEQGWGWWRRYIARNPLTGSWISMAVGAALVAGAWRLLG